MKMFHERLHSFFSVRWNFAASASSTDLNCISTGRVKLVFVVNRVIVQIEYPAVELTYVLHYGRGNETCLDKILQHTLHYPLGVFDIALASRKLFDEIRVDKLEVHTIKQLVPQFIQ